MTLRKFKSWCREEPATTLIKVCPVEDPTVRLPIYATDQVVMPPPPTLVPSVQNNHPRENPMKPQTDRQAPPTITHAVSKETKDKRRIVSPINYERLEFELQAHPNQAFVNKLSTELREGGRMG